MTASGDLVRADPERHADLFWALRGGGGGFGIVTEVEVDLLPLAEVFAGLVVFDMEHAQTVVRAYRDWALSAPREVTSSVRFLRPPPLPDVPEPLRGRALIGITAAHTGPEAEAAERLRPLREAAPPVMDTFGTIPAAGLCRIHADPSSPCPESAVTRCCRCCPTRPSTCSCRSRAQTRQPPSAGRPAPPGRGPRRGARRSRRARRPAG